ncbi:MAG: hypothetical protein MPI95_04140, partial [Nitrosopumilus sp.]|nr:hypothetical protein [Nitrosopumilus sp.]
MADGDGHPSAEEIARIQREIEDLKKQHAKVVASERKKGGGTRAAKKPASKKPAAKPAAKQAAKPAPKKPAARPAPKAEKDPKKAPAKP